MRTKANGPFHPHDSEEPKTCLGTLVALRWIMTGARSCMNVSTQVTTTSNKSGKFEVRFFSQIYQHELGTVGGHFGPINSLAFNPDGKRSVHPSVSGHIPVAAAAHATPL